MSVKTLSSSDELESAVKKNEPTAVWVFDSDGANRGFGKHYEEWIAKEISGVTFYKAGTDDIKESIKKHGLSPDWVAFFKNGEYVKEEREDHNAVYNAAKGLA